jgi:uncharacterized membrane protein
MKRNFRLKTKKHFQLGIFILLAIGIVVKLLKTVLLTSIDVWAGFFNPMNNLLLKINEDSFWYSFALILSGIVCIYIVGRLFGIKVKQKKLTRILGAHVPGIKSFLKLTDKLKDLQNKGFQPAIYERDNGEKAIVIINPNIIEVHSEGKSEKMVQLFYTITPYPFSGLPLVVPINRIKIIENFSFGDFLRFITTGGLLFGLPEEITLKNLTDAD